MNFYNLRTSTLLHIKKFASNKIKWTKKEKGTIIILSALKRVRLLLRIPTGMFLLIMRSSFILLNRSRQEQSYTYWVSEEEQ